MEENRMTIFAKMSTQTLCAKLQFYRRMVKRILMDIEQNRQYKKELLKRPEDDLTDKILRVKCYSNQVQRIQQILMERTF